MPKPILSDLVDLHHPGKPGQLFNIQTKSVKGHLVFVIQAMKWNDAKQDNDYRIKLDMMPAAFAVWYGERDAEGWRVMP